MKDEKKITTFKGWVGKIRNLGKLLFFDIQSGEKKIQVIVIELFKIKEIIKEINSGDLVSVKGELKEKKSKNELKEFEILLENWEIINKTKNLPFEIKDDLELKEDNKYRYRYLDLRRKKSREIIIEKNNFLHYIRNFFHKNGFIDIETPILSQSSPEGAKTFLVQSNLKDKFYTLAQSPQIFKQTLMISGFEKYYQIAKSFRNEDSRSNRQIEFSQLDIEMSFANQNYLFQLTEKMITDFLIEKFKVKREKISFEIIEFEDCINKYGSDKPDLRNELEIKNFDFLSTFSDNFERGIFIENSFNLNLDKVKKILKENEFIEFLLFENRINKIVIIEEKNSNKKKNFEESFKNYKSGVYMIVSGKKKYVLSTLSKIRESLNNLFVNKKEKAEEYKFLWITKWPLFEFDNEKKKIISVRHPFTIPKKDDQKKIFSDNLEEILSIKSEAYDLVCNGEELASGSLRIYKREMQERVFEILGFTKNELEKHFGYFLESLEFAAPPHGGIALGIERMMMVFFGLKNLKETIAFPKNIDGTCSLTGSPNFV